MLFYSLLCIPNYILYGVFYTLRYPFIEIEWINIKKEVQKCISEQFA